MLIDEVITCRICEVEVDYELVEAVLVRVVCPSCGNALDDDGGFLQMVRDTAIRHRVLKAFQ